MNWKNIIADLMHSGLSQAQIAASCKTGQSHISSLARGLRKRPNWDLGERLLKLHEERSSTTKHAA